MNRHDTNPDVPQGKWFPDVGERVFVPMFDTMGVVEAICPRLLPDKTAAEAIWYLVRLDRSWSMNHSIGERRHRQGEASLFLAEELINARFVGQIPQPAPKAE